MRGRQESGSVEIWNWLRGWVRVWLRDFEEPKSGLRIRRADLKFGHYMRRGPPRWRHYGLFGCLGLECWVIFDGGGGAC
jgi:hypothetical protein